VEYNSSLIKVDWLAACTVPLNHSKNTIDKEKEEGKKVSEKKI
jgi:hypothetical protein